MDATISRIWYVANMNRVLGQRISDRLRLIGKSQTELARAVGMRQSSIAMVAGGKVKRPGKLLEIADFLDTTEEYLLGRTDDPKRPQRKLAADDIGERVPILSWVSAGRLADPETPIYAEPGDGILVGGLGRGEFFALRVEGDSMNRISPPDSIIIVNRRERIAIGGKPYVFAVRGQVTYKLWRPGGPLSYLAPSSTNPLNEPILIARKRDLEVIGRVRRTILDL